ncbi:MAG TPA: beta-galactosidase [Bacteroidota bacterium]|nr:beta-galactosidase [Bacteroidota bacterium]
MRNRRRACTGITLAALSLLSAVRAAPGDPGLDLSGLWQFRMDPRDAGVRERWFLQKFDDSLRLPGSMAGSGKGDPASVGTKWVGGIVDSSWFTDARYAPYRKSGEVRLPFWLTQTRVYHGAAWYRREIDISPQWSGRRIVLSLERAHWETRLWVDSTEAGMRNSLAAPHEYDITPLISPGRHTITLRVDNRIGEIDVGSNAHSVTDHTQTDWNGIIGRIVLQSGSPVFIERLSVFPDAGSRVFTIVVRLRNTTGRPQSGELTFCAGPRGSAAGRTVVTRQTIAADTLTAMNWYPLGPDAPLWDEFQPNLYDVSVSWRGEESRMRDQRQVVSGLRDFRATPDGFTVNGRPTFLRGTLDCVLAPLTGYPSMSEDDWDREFDAICAYGLNHVRFHSWCPPEAAFASADRHGLYLQVECGAWCTVGDGRPVDAWLYDESRRIVDAYGNHPSFCMMAYGNEPSGRRMDEYLSGFVRYWKQRDGRRLYTAGAGWPVIPESDYLSKDKARIQVWGMGLTSIINRDPPSTQFDFRDTVNSYRRPIVAHETGQWCVFPDFREIPRYTGVLRAGNFEIIRDDLRSKGMEGLDSLFVQASGKLQALCYKADIEAAERTPRLAGFQLLGLHDFPGQGTAPVGVLNVFSEAKGYITPEEFSRFCSPTVPLARMKKLVYLNTEDFTADCEVSHFGPAPLVRCHPVWNVTDAKGNTVSSGACPVVDVPLGHCTPLGRVRVHLKGFPAPGMFRFELRVGERRNSWNFWVYPARIPRLRGGQGLLVTDRLDGDALSMLKRGGRVLLTLRKCFPGAERGEDIALGFSTVFWNTAWTHGQPPHTLGILCDPAHPALASFPTSFHTDYQWWDLITHAQAVRLDSLPGVEPLIRVIDDWNRNRPLALAFEVRSGGGALLVSGIDLMTDIGHRPEARQLLYSLSSYMRGPRFRPVHALEIGTLLGFAPDPLHKMQR